jgi:TonB-dependent starch-binding outer membrane protein SusC
VTVVFTYYDQKTEDALFNVRQIPSNGGWSSQLKNVGTLQNKGVELSVDAIVLQREGFAWEVGGSVSTNHSKTLDLGGAAPFSLGSYGWIVEGQPVPVMRAYCIENEDELAEPIISSDLCDIGPNSPTHTYIGSTQLQLPRGITLSARGEYQGGHYGQALLSGEGIVRGIRWPSCFNAYPALDAGDKSQLTAKVRAMCQSSLARRDFAMYPLDFFRVREVSLNAPIPFRVPGTESASISISGQNLWMWRKANDSFVDPETSGGFNDGSTGMQQRVRSVEGSIPIPAVYLVSLRFSF